MKFEGQHVSLHVRLTMQTYSRSRCRHKNGKTKQTLRTRRNSISGTSDSDLTLGVKDYMRNPKMLKKVFIESRSIVQTMYV